MGLQGRFLIVAQYYSGSGKESNDHLRGRHYHFSSHAKIKGATMVASLSTINLGVSMASFPQVIFSLGTAPEYEPYEVVESEIWQK